MEYGGISDFINKLFLIGKFQPFIHGCKLGGNYEENYCRFKTKQACHTQTKWVIEQLKKLDDSFDFEVKEIVTKGDRIVDVTLSKVGGKGLFVKEIEQAMMDHEIDMAVHSMKDMPALLPEGLVIGCIPEREDHRDALISKNHVKFNDLKSGAIVGTSSLRRGSQLLAMRPDLEIKWIRGNIDTRLEKLRKRGL